MLENVSEYYDEEIDESLNRLLTMLEPALLIGMGGVIAIMLLAMYLPLFELQSVAV
jgi:type IV pilus assembly protein PilC